MSERMTAAQRRSCSIILSTFEKNGRRKFRRAEASGSRLYDAAGYLCRLMNMPIASYERVCEVGGENAALEDIARVSGFLSRTVTLEDGWERNLSSPILCRRKGETDYLVCHPGRGGRVELTDPVSNATHTASRQELAALENKAVVFHRTFSGGKVTFSEIVRLSLQVFSVRDLLFCMVCTGLATLISVQLATLNQLIFDEIIPTGDTSEMIGLGVVLLSCMAANLCFSVTGNLLSYRISSSIRYTLQGAIYEHIFHLPEKCFREKESAEQAYRIQKLNATYISTFQDALQILLQGGFSVIYVWKMHRYSPTLSHLSMGFVVLNIAITIGIGFLDRNAQQKKSNATGRLRSFLYQSLQGVESIRTAGAEENVLCAHIELTSEAGLADQGAAWNKRFAAALSTSGSALAMLALYWTYATQHLDVNIGVFMGFLTALTAFSAAMCHVADAGMDIASSLPTLRDSSELLRIAPETSAAGQIPRTLTGDIELSHVSFAYEKKGKPVLNDVSLHIRPGEYVGIVGTTGCGKSTLLRLLLGFESPTAGQIYYDGVSVDHFSLPEFRRKLGVVMQEGKLFSGTIYRNIAVACPKAGPEEIQRAAEDAQLTEVLEKMPMGLNTFVSEQGRTLSGGERQRILIARALVGRPSILLFDEATSALDNVSQARICESLRAYEATRIVIAHRLSTVVHCDRIVVLANGGIAEEGSYAELMAKKGAFYELARHQVLE